MLSIITGKTQELMGRRPQWPFTTNMDSSQSQSLKVWVPMGVPKSGGEKDLVKDIAYAATGTNLKVEQDLGIVRDFEFGSSEYLSYNGAEVTATPLTVACWLVIESFGSSPITLLSLHNSGSTTQRECFLLFLDQTTNNVKFLVGAATNAGTATDDGLLPAMSTERLYHAAGVAKSSTSRFAYRNGYPGGQSTTSRTPSGINITHIGAEGFTAGPGRFFDGRIGDARIYSREFNHSEVWELYDPRSRWELYYPLGRKLYAFNPPAVVGRTTKNTRSHPLGVYVGTNWRSTGPVPIY